MIYTIQAEGCGGELAMGDTPPESVKKENHELFYQLALNKPFKINTDFGIKQILNKKLLLENFPNFRIIVKKSNEDFDLMKKIESTKINITIKDYVKNYLNKPQSLYYFKSEDEYDFLHELKLKNDILNKYGFGKRGRLSFWWGNKGSITSFHYDSYGFKEDKMIKFLHGENFYKKPYGHSILTVIEGKKKIYIIHPEYSKYLKHDTTLQNGAAWCIETTEDVLNNENIKYDTVILNEGESLNIPMFWWHKVENLKQGTAITYSFTK
jgi:hypothetical protein